MKRALGRFVLWIFGWDLAGPAPTEPKFIVIAHPHTSNWDYVFMIGAALAYGTPLRWLGKKELFDSPLGWLFRLSGGIPVDRGHANNLVEAAVKWFRESDRMILAVPPAGTRKPRAYWKSGFYHIALAAGVPINLAKMDYLEKRAGYGPCFLPTGDVRADMDFIRAHYAVTHPRFPECVQRPRLAAEDEPGTEGALHSALGPASPAA